MATKHTDNWLDIVKRLNELSNITPEEERAQLMEAARQEPRILDDNDVTLADIAKLAGIKEYTETTKVSKKAEALIESITQEKTEESIITKAIREADTKERTVAEEIEQEVKKESKRLDKIAELQAKIEELKSQELEENTYDEENFKGKLRELLEYFLKNATLSQMVDMYKMIADENIKVGEDGRVTIGELVNELEEDDKDDSGFTDKQIKMAFGVLNDPKYKGGNYDGAVEVINKIAPGLADHPSVKNALMRANEDTNEASGHEGQSEPRKHSVKGDASTIEKKLKDAGVQAEVKQDGENVEIHTMSDKDTVEKAVKEVNYTDELSENNQQGK
jgi:hypothetical protein